MYSRCTDTQFSSKCMILLLFVIDTIVGKLQLEMIGPQRIFVDISETNIWIDPGVICRNGTSELASITTAIVDFTVRGQYTLEYDCRPIKATRSISVGPVACPMLWNPVCCSSKIYSNDCEAFADACFILTSDCDQHCTVVECRIGFILTGQDKNRCGGFCLLSLF